MKIRVDHNIDDLANDLTAVATNARAKFSRTIRDNIDEGNRFAANLARRTAGAHGKHYHRAFSAEMVTPLIGEYGPDAAKPQGGMSFERGSRNQPPHNDLAKSADIQGPKFAKGVGRDLDGLFW